LTLLTTETLRLPF
jgi:hypothetical protein